MSKDPAVLVYVNNWLSSTAGMDADCRGWYINLLLHNYDKGCLPSDMEQLAVLASVKFSEYNRFEQVFEQVLKHKFIKNEDGSITNLKTQSILKGREEFKEKRSEAGKKSYLSKFLAKNYPKQFKNNDLKNYILENIDLSIDLKNEQMLKQVFEQMFELYINVNVNINKDISISNSSSKNNKIDFSVFWDLYDKKVGDKNGCKKKWDKLSIDTQNIIIETIPAFKLSIENKKFQPHPATYLNQERWNDETSVQKTEVEIIDGESEEDRFHREWKKKNKIIPLH